MGRREPCVSRRPGKIHCSSNATIIMTTSQIDSPAADIPADNDVAAVVTDDVSTADLRTDANQDAINMDPNANPTANQDETAIDAAQETNPSESAESAFAALQLDPQVVQAVERSGYDQPTPIQLAMIPQMLAGRDVIGQAQTGTGKTAAFALPILSSLDMSQREPQVLVLAPTRELALQVADSFATYGVCIPKLNVAAIFGGQDYAIQLRQLRRGAQIVVGTPGRVLDHVQRGSLNLNEVRCVVLDEADEMLNMGFLEDVEFVLQNTPNRRQIALFSATLPDAIRRIAAQHLKDPKSITIGRRQEAVIPIRQRCVIVPEHEKLATLCRMLEVEDTDGVIVFTRTRETTTQLAEQLVRAGLSAAAINGDLPQNQRQRTIDRLKSGKLDVLVATDVAARGLDVQRISHVFNFDAPHDGESYIHRIGRTGRAGRSGEAVIFLTPRQRGRLRSLERTTNQRLEIVEPPSAKEINAKRIARFQERLVATANDMDLSFYEDLIAKHVESSGQSLSSVAAALAAIAQGSAPFFVEDRPRRSQAGFSSAEDRPGRSERSPREDRSGARDLRRTSRISGPPQPGMERFRIEVGRVDGVRPGNIVGAIANEAGIDGKNIGPIQIDYHYSIVDLPQGMPTDIYEHLQQVWVAGKPLRLTRLGNDFGRGRRKATRPTSKAKPVHKPKRTKPGQTKKRDKKAKKSVAGLTASPTRRSNSAQWILVPDHAQLVTFLAGDNIQVAIVIQVQDLDQVELDARRSSQGTL